MYPRGYLTVCSIRAPDGTVTCGSGVRKGEGGGSKGTRGSLCALSLGFMAELADGFDRVIICNGHCVCTQGLGLVHVLQTGLVQYSTCNVLYRSDTVL